MSGREEILARVRDALKDRTAIDHPGAFDSWRPPGAPAAAPIERFAAMLQTAGGEVVRVRNDAAGAEWLAGFCGDFVSVTVGDTVPLMLRPPLPALGCPRRAPISAASAHARRVRPRCCHPRHLP
jgi:hypothetical protein